MSKVARELNALQNQMEGGAPLPHQATDWAMRLFTLSHDTQVDPSAVQKLLEHFLDSLPEWGLEDLPARTAEYAHRLATAPGELEYEELHKLFSLRDELHVLCELGMSIGSQAQSELDAALRARFQAQKKAASSVAQDRAEDWNRNLWWYAERLNPRARK
jgi:hypothetical protein